MIGGIRNIRYAATANLNAESKASAHYYAKPVVAQSQYKEICDTYKGTIQLNRNIQNGTPIYDATITFQTLTQPTAFVNAKSFAYTDGQGRNWILGWDDEDDYPVVTWEESNQKGNGDFYKITIAMKSKVGVMRVL